MSDSEQQLADLERRMLAEIPGWLADLASALESLDGGDIEGRQVRCNRLGQQAHKLRGRAALLGLAGLAGAAGDVEALCLRHARHPQLAAAVARCLAHAGGAAAGS